MSRAAVSRRIYEMLVNHLKRIEEEKLAVIEKYYSVWTNERSDFQELMDSYIKCIENAIHNELEINDNISDACPFVIIGSQVQMKDCYTNKIEELQIVSPFSDEKNYDVDNASYLSPMGRAFLLKKANDDVMVETPMGIFQYKIESIGLPENFYQ